MKKRVIWKMFFLTVVTLGIYRIYWFIKTRQEMMDRNPNVKVLSPLLLALPFVLILTSIGLFAFNIIKLYSAARDQPSYCQSLRQAQTTQNSYQSEQALPTECQIQSPTWTILLIYASILLFYPLMAVWLWGYSKAVEAITADHTSFAMALLILLVVPDGIDILIIQESFNKLGDGSQPVPDAGAPQPIAT